MMKDDHDDDHDDDENKNDHDDDENKNIFLSMLTQLYDLKSNASNQQRRRTHYGTFTMQSNT